MKKEKKKLMKLKSELKIYNKIKDKSEKVLSEELDICDLDDYLFSKIRKIEDEIDALDFQEKEVIDVEVPKYGPGDEVFYEGVSCMVMSVNHKDNTYDLKSSTDRAWVNWNLLK